MVLEDDLQRSLLAIRASVSTLCAAHRSRDNFAVEHEERVAEVALGIGRALGMDRGRLDVLNIAAKVHDIGKIAVPSGILAKPGALSEAEYALVKEHCHTGYKILQNLQTHLPIAEIAYQHHERMDGSGYPRRLAGDQILPEARILAVADIFDAMTSNRAYRPGLPQEFVLEEVRKMAGSKLDPAVVDALIQSQCAASRTPEALAVVA
jgi:HD-GYP domain-containing protein (c-di-GMP phosphodiesterase class II)